MSTVATTRARGTTNGNRRGSSYSRAARRAWLVETYRANVDLLFIDLSGNGPRPDDWISRIRVVEVPVGLGVPACRCYRCGVLLTVETVSVDRIVPGCKGGTYRRDNIRPACGTCNSETGGKLGADRRAR